MVLGVVLLVAFVFVESRSAEPIVPLELFRNRVFTVTGAIGFIVGQALFGAVTYLPLYLQIVKGHSPTTSGLLLTPLMAGVLVTSIGSGQLISRFGHYKPFPIAGTALMTVAMLLLSRISVGMPTWQAALLMVLLGFGLGMTMQVLVLAAQNGPLRIARRGHVGLDVVPSGRRLDQVVSSARSSPTASGSTSPPPSLPACARPPPSAPSSSTG